MSFGVFDISASREGVSKGGERGSCRGGNSQGGYSSRGFFLCVLLSTKFLVKGIGIAT